MTDAFLPVPRVTLRDGTLWSHDFDDLYFSAEDGPAETAHTFLDGTGFGDLTAAPGDRLVVAELGFGTGLNLLMAWAAWAEAGRQRFLHFVSLEGFPLTVEQMADAHSLLPDRLKPYADRLRRVLPPRRPGVHAVQLEPRLTLTLRHEQWTEETAPDATGWGAADVWFLDGFAPRRNPAMWSHAAQLIAQASRPGARIATFTAAAHVRRALQAIGAEVLKRPGYGRKREHLVATLPNAPARSPIGRARIHGAGIAGACLADALARRGVAVDWIDPRGPAAQASGNPQGAVMPTLTVDPSPTTDLFRAAMPWAAALYRSLGEALPQDWTGALWIPKDDQQRDRWPKLAAAHGDWVQAIDAADARTRSGLALDQGGVWIADAGWIEPPAAVRGLIDRTGPAPRQILEPLPEDDTPTVLCIGAEPLVPLSMGLRAAWGQLTCAETTEASAALRCILTMGPYALPARDGRHVLGATFDTRAMAPLPDSLPVTDAAHQENRTKIAAMLGQALPLGPTVGGRTAARAVLPDRLPAVGSLLSHADLLRWAESRDGADRSEPAAVSRRFVLTGLGARGLTTAPFLAELLARQLLAEPLPCAPPLLDALSPLRFVRRALKRGQPLPD